MAKKDIPKAKKPLSEEDSIRIKEQIIIDAQKELERQNQFALERQKREAYEASQRDMLRYYENKAQGKNEDPIVTNKKPSIRRQLRLRLLLLKSRNQLNRSIIIIALSRRKQLSKVMFWMARIN